MNPEVQGFDAHLAPKFSAWYERLGRHAMVIPRYRIG